ncbi:BZ3500_MvSof-1268-A1-R1_Chr1-1g00823 [Microbotryum saponariae]|uniref:BZ3500_MvSof-1268-A1-R1_Chr1-1g00823 protein n=1 Tax=Microbotryum saponariae TaxID=289078 RepID=A0A2X0MCL0_9BASI|nr:BZ3500_MvSof-1268-A1-R1_Chr1-1g00823 [Microbotryum saponariae]SCZ92745.1 BZ3501_MvSof-1269-A2-R1_Chr1-1g00420 [Microbotryum saponariae]
MVLPDLDTQFFVPTLKGAKTNFKGSSLVLPQPSLGSLPQLALDLYVHTFQLELVGCAALRDTIPCVGGVDVVEGEQRQSVQGGFSWATQGPSLGAVQLVCGEVSRIDPVRATPHPVYQTPSSASNGDSITLLLPRAPIIQARKRHYFDALTAWIRQSEFRDVLIVGAVDAAMRGDDGLRETNPFRSIVLPIREGTDPSPLLERLSKSVRPYFKASDPSSKKTIPAIPHGGLTRSLLQHLSTSEDGASLPTVGALLVYTAEGENEALAKGLGDVVRSLIVGSDGSDLAGTGSGTEWKVPKSWKLGLMGDELGSQRRSEMYG